VEVVLQVDIDKNLLTLSVHQEEDEKENQKSEERKEEGKEEVKEKKASDSGITWHHTERFGVFAKRRVRLPENADTSAASASYTDGVLTIKIPKKPLVDTSMKLTIS
jgi:HSP20 family molecular chaperone IbpA